MRVRKDLWFLKLPSFVKCNLRTPLQVLAQRMFNVNIPASTERMVKERAKMV